MSTNDKNERPASPGVLKRRREAREDYVCSKGHVPNPDRNDFRRPGVTPEEAEQIEKQMMVENAIAAGEPVENAIAAGEPANS